MSSQRLVIRNGFGELLDVDPNGVFRKLEESRNYILSRGELLPDWASESVSPA